MPITVRFKLYAEEAEAVNNFARQVGVSVDTIAKQSLFMTISRALNSARELQKQLEAGELDGKNRDTETDNAAISLGEDANPHTLANSEANTDTDTGGSEQT